MDNLILNWKKLEPLPVLDENSSPSAPSSSPCGRCGHGLSLVDGGKKLILYGGLKASSGENGYKTPLALEDSQVCWALDLVEDDKSLRWRRVDCAGGPPNRTRHAQAADKEGGKVYVFGGKLDNGTVLNDLWVLDCSSSSKEEKWSQMEYNTVDDGCEAFIPEPRMGSKMVRVNNSLFVFGGCDGEGKPFHDLLKLNLETRTWDNLGKPTKLTLSDDHDDNIDLLVLASKRKVGIVVGGYTEGQRYKVHENLWVDHFEKLNKIENKASGNTARPDWASFPSVDVVFVFGCTTNGDIVVLDESRGKYLETIPAPPAGSYNQPWPEGPRSRTACATHDWKGGRGVMYMFGGAKMTSTTPEGEPEGELVFDDLWKLDVTLEDNDDYNDLRYLRRAM